MQSFDVIRHYNYNYITVNGVITVMVHYTTWAALAGLIALQLHYHYTLHITRPHYTRRNANTLGAS